MKKIFSKKFIFAAVLLLLLVIALNDDASTPDAAVPASDVAVSAPAPVVAPGGASLVPEKPEVNSKADFSKLTPGCFVARQSPVIKIGDLFSGSTWNDPHVLKVGDQYVMYASSDVNFNGDIKIYRLVSGDGISWSLSPSTPVFVKPESRTAWDRKSVETPGVVYFKGQYYLFYTGYSDASGISSFRIGYATSPDGITFTRAPNFIVAPTDPGGAPNLAFNQFMVGEPGPVVFNDSIYLYFTAMGADMSVGTTLQTIGVMTSSDGTTWSAAQQALKPDQGLYPRAAGWIGYSTPHAAVLGGKVHLFVDVASEVPSWKQLKIHHAVSDNGVTGWKQDAIAIFDHLDIPWTTEEIRSPAVYLDGSSLKMWFAGHTNPKARDFIMGIGYAVCEL